LKLILKIWIDKFINKKWNKKTIKIRPTYFGDSDEHPSWLEERMAQCNLVPFSSRSPDRAVSRFHSWKHGCWHSSSPRTSTRWSGTGWPGSDQGPGFCRFRWALCRRIGFLFLLWTPRILCFLPVLWKEGSR